MKKTLLFLAIILLFACKKSTTNNTTTTTNTATLQSFVVVQQAGSWQSGKLTCILNFDTNNIKKLEVKNTCGALAMLFNPTEIKLNTPFIINDYFCEPCLTSSLLYNFTAVYKDGTFNQFATIKAR